MASALLLSDLKQFVLDAQKNIDNLNEIPADYRRGWHDCCDMLLRSVEYTESKTEE